MSFRDFLEKFEVLFEGSDICMFFKKDGSVYGTTESGRITFARIKNPESKEDLAWKKDATMIVYDLEKGSDDNKVMIGAGQIDELKPISQEQAEKILKKKGKELPSIKDDDDDDDGYYGEE